MVTLMRLWGFIRGASVIIISTITALWLLQGIPVVAGTGGFTHVDDVHESAYGMLADAAVPVFAPAGFDDWHASAALITGFVAKEVVVGSMSQSYHADGADDTASQQAGEGRWDRSCAPRSTNRHTVMAGPQPSPSCCSRSPTRPASRRSRKCDGNSARKSRRVPFR